MIKIKCPHCHKKVGIPTQKDWAEHLIEVMNCDFYKREVEKLKIKKNEKELKSWAEFENELKFIVLVYKYAKKGNIDMMRCMDNIIVQEDLMPIIKCKES